MNFESENIQVDWLSFNVQGLIEKNEIRKIANCLSHLDFGSKIKNSDQNEEELIYENPKKYQVRFVSDSKNKYWTGTTVIFSGKDAAAFYKCIKKRTFDWNIFDIKNTNLGRIDLRIFSSPKNYEGLLDFFERSVEKSKKNFKNIKTEIIGCESERTLILRIGDRKASNYYRIYQSERKNGEGEEKGFGLAFELEIKKKGARNFQTHLFSNKIEEFEEDLSKHLYKQSAYKLDTDSSFSRWVSQGLRKIKTNDNKKNRLSLPYINFDSRGDQVQKDRFYLYRIFQLLSFIKGLDKSEQSLGEQKFYIIQFEIYDFLKFIGETKFSYYQRNQIIAFIRQLHLTNLVFEFFDDETFRRSTGFPYIEVKKVGRSWKVLFAIVSELYDYSYSFLTTKSFLTFKEKDDLYVKSSIIIALATRPLKKVIHLEELIFSKKINNHRIKKRKELIIKLLTELHDSHIIKSQLSLVNLHTLHKIDINIRGLKTHLIGKYTLLIFRENEYMNL